MYYLPVWFQAIEGVSAVESGIRSLPLILEFVLSTMIGGGLVTKYGYYAPCMIASSVLMSIGAGLLIILTPASCSRQWVGFQVLLGLGVGLGLQQGLIAVQTALPSEDITSGTAVVIFAGSLGAAACPAIAQAIFTNSLVASLAVTVPGLDPNVVTNIGATSLNNSFPSEFADGVQVAYNKALAQTFYMAIGTGCLSVIVSLLIEWKSVIKDQDLDAEAGVTEAGEVSSLHKGDVVVTPSYFNEYLHFRKLEDFSTPRLM